MPEAERLPEAESLPNVVQAGVEEIAQDHTSGAAALGAQGAQVLRLLGTASRTKSPQVFRREVSEAARALMAAQPTMAPLVSLSNEALLAVEAASGLGAARQALEGTASQFLTRQASAAEEIARHTVALLPARGVVLTHSSSETVLLALRHARLAGLNLSVICTESRPNLEGRSLASRLAEEGFRARIVVDAAGPGLVREADLMMVGADAVTEEGLVNKVGTYALALGASRSGTPCYALCGTDKFLPSGYPLVVRDEDPSEVWPEAPPGLRITNRYFEVTPWDLIRGMVTEDGAFSPTQIQETLATRPLHPELL